MSDRPDEPVEILLVEDNPGDVRLTREAFAQSDFEATLRIAENGGDAIDFLLRREDGGTDRYPDLVLLDLNMPQVDGFAVLEAIRDDPEIAPLPVLVLTGSDAREDVVRSYELYANAYLTKPSRHEDFVSLARAVEEFWFEAARLPPAPS